MVSKKVARLTRKLARVRHGEILVRATESEEEENGVRKVASARQWASAKSDDSVRGSRKKSVGNDNERLPWRDNRQVSYLDRKPRAYAYTYIRLASRTHAAVRIESEFCARRAFLTLLLTDGLLPDPPVR